MLDLLIMYSSMNTQNPPKWASVHQTTLMAAAAKNEDIKKSLSSPPQQCFTNPNNGTNTDEHFSRHLENLTEKNVNGDDKDEHEADHDQDDSNVKVNPTEHDEEEYDDDEPKAFQVEDVDLPSLVTKPSSNSKPTSPMIDTLKVEKFAFSKAKLTVTKTNFTTKTEPQAKGEQQQLEVSDVKQELVTTRSTKLDEAPLTAEINLTSQMATPMHYFSRSSSMTSLNSFDVKSIHSEVASEYSQVTSQVTSPSYKHRRDGEFNHSGYMDDLENLNMPDSPSALENSFLNAQRYIHKQQQQIYRQNAAAAMSSVNQPPVLVSTMNFQMNKIMANPSMFNEPNFKILKNEMSFNHMSQSQHVNLAKPWNSHVQTTTTLIQKPSPSHGNDLNLIMQRLNIKQGSNDKNSNKTTVGTVNKPKIDSESDSDTASDSSDSLSFLNENQNKNNPEKIKAATNGVTNALSLNHTPPVKLQAPARIIPTKPDTVGESTACKPTTATMPSLNQFNASSAQPGMSVSYAFMKNSFSQFAPSSLPINAGKGIDTNGLQQQQQPTMPPLIQPQFLYQPPKFLQNANQSYQAYQQAMQFNKNTFAPQQPQQSGKTLESQQTCSSTSSHDSQTNTIKTAVELSPTSSDTPYVYMVEKTSKVLTPQASKIRPVFPESDRPPSPQESVCSMMSDSSVPSIIRADISRSNIGFQQVKQQPQNEFKALFNKLNQNQNQNNTICDQNVTITNQPMMPKPYFNFEPKPQNNLLPAFNFLKSAPSFNQQQGYFSSQNTPTNMNMNMNPTYSDLDCTYSPKVFQHEGTNSRYDSENEEPAIQEEKENDEEQDLSEAIIIQNSTQIEKPLADTQLDDQSDELLLENFIKEMLPPVDKSPDKKVNRPRMSSSVSSEAPFVQLSSKTKFRNSGSSSSLNNISVKSRLNLTKTDNKFQATTATKRQPTQQKTASTLSNNKPIAKSNTTTSKHHIKPHSTTTASKTTVPAKEPLKASINKNPTVTTSNRSLNKLTSAAPVVNMTRTAQLRMAKMQSANANNTSLNSTINSGKVATKPKVSVSSKVNSVRSTRPSAKENMNSKETANSVHVNPHLDHLNRGVIRRQSFSFGQSINKKSRVNGDTSVNLGGDASMGAGEVKSSASTVKPRSTWR